VGAKILTETKARSISLESGNFADGTVPGLTLQPSATNKRGRWNLRFTSPETGKRRDMGLGTFPEVSIADARDLAIQARKQVASGTDPIRLRTEQTKAREASSQRMTFEKAAQEACKDLISHRSERHKSQWINTLSQHVFPIIGGKEVALLEPDDFRQVLQPIWLTKSETALRILQRCKTVMDWCVARRLLTNNPTAVVTMLLPKMKKKHERTVHQPALAWENVPAFVRDVLNDGRTGTCRQALEFLILSATRSGEVRNMQWSEIDETLCMWIISKDRMKSGREHRVPLTWRMLEIIEKQRELKLHSTLVFPSPRGKVMSDNTLSKFLRDHMVKSTLKGRFAVVHGFRSSFRDWGAEKSLDRQALEACLAHAVRDAVESAYLRTDLIKIRTAIMTEWTNYVCGPKND
jgi:integrase